MSPGPRSTSVPSGVFIHPAVRPTIDMGQKLGGVCPFFQGIAGSLSNPKSTGPRPTSIPSGILVHPAVRPQWILAENWGLCPFRGGELGSHLTQCCVGRGLPPYQVASRSMQPFGHNRRGPKIGGLRPLSGSGGWVPI